MHSAIEEVQFESLLHKLQKGTGRKSKKPPAWASKGDSIIARLKITGGAGRVCVERFEDYNQLGRFVSPVLDAFVGMVTNFQSRPLEIRSAYSESPFLSFDLHERSSGSAC